MLDVNEPVETTRLQELRTDVHIPYVPGFLGSDGQDQSEYL